MCDFNITEIDGQKIKPEDAATINAPFTVEELRVAVKSLKRDKCPGNQGLNAEFYQFFWNKIENLFFEAFQYADEMGEMTLSARRGVIMLIPKRGKTLKLLKNWRPLTMLNIFYKIIAKALAKRMQTVLPYLISETQTGFMTGRQITTTLRATLDITKMSKKVQGYILLLDFEKCFDRISYDAIIGSLRLLGFGEYFIRIMSLLLNNFESCTGNNGHFSTYFPVTRSCHQGCPVGPANISSLW